MKGFSRMFDNENELVLVPLAYSRVFESTHDGSVFTHLEEALAMYDSTSVWHGTEHALKHMKSEAYHLTEISFRMHASSAHARCPNGIEAAVTSQESVVRRRRDIFEALEPGSSDTLSKLHCFLAEAARMYWMTLCMVWGKMSKKQQRASLEVGVHRKDVDDKFANQIKMIQTDIRNGFHSTSLDTICHFVSVVAESINPHTFD